MSKSDSNKKNNTSRSVSKSSRVTIKPSTSIPSASLVSSSSSLDTISSVNQSILTDSISQSDAISEASPLSELASLSSVNSISTVEVIKDAEHIELKTPSIEEGWAQLKEIILEVKAHKLDPQVARNQVYQLALTSAFHLPSPQVEAMIPQMEKLIQTQPELRQFLDLHLGKKEE